MAACPAATRVGISDRGFTSFRTASQLAVLDRQGRLGQLGYVNDFDTLFKKLNRGRADARIQVRYP